MEVQLVTRRGCHLCDQALAALRELGVEPALRDVDEDADLFRLYDFRVPVVLMNGREVGEGRLQRGWLARRLGLPDFSVRPCGEEAATTVHMLTQSAFREYAWLAPPSGVTRESEDSVRADLAATGGVLAFSDEVAIGCLRLDGDRDGSLHVRRLAVDPAWRGRGAGTALMRWAESEALRRGLSGMEVGVRLNLPENLAFYSKLGYSAVSEHRHPGFDHATWVTMKKQLA